MDLKTYLTKSPRGTAASLAKSLAISPSYLSQIASGWSLRLSSYRFRWGICQCQSGTWQAQQLFSLDSLPKRLARIIINPADCRVVSRIYEPRHVRGFFWALELPLLPLGT